MMGVASIVIPTGSVVVKGLGWPRLIWVLTGASVVSPIHWLIGSPPRSCVVVCLMLIGNELSIIRRVRILSRYRWCCWTWSVGSLMRRVLVGCRGWSRVCLSLIVWVGQAVASRRVLQMRCAMGRSLRIIGRSGSISGGSFASTATRSRGSFARLVVHSQILHGAVEILLISPGRFLLVCTWEGGKRIIPTELLRRFLGRFAGSMLRSTRLRAGRRACVVAIGVLFRSACFARGSWSVFPIIRRVISPYRTTVA